MLFKVTSIEFDFTGDEYPPTLAQQRDLVNSVCLGDWDADSEDDLVESITDETGWCINTLTYDIVNI
jgi:hypothetical protein